MPLIEWNDELLVGDPVIDEDHRRLAETVNALHENIVQGHSMNRVNAALIELVSHADRHFRHEERLMREKDYPGYEEHKRQHEDLEADIAALLKRFEAGESLYSLRIMDFLADWLLTHIHLSDKALGQYLAAQHAGGA